MKKLLTIGVFALALTAGGASAGEVLARFEPPPPPREIVVVRPSHRHVWVPGYHRWTGNRYVWVNGYWAMPPRPHAVWVPGRWTPRRGGYVWVAGFWR